MNNEPQNKTEGSKLVLYLLVILPGLLMFVLPEFFSSLMKARDPIRNSLRGYGISVIVGFLISLYIAARLVRKNQTTEARFDQIVGWAILITLANLVIAFFGCSLVR